MPAQGLSYKGPVHRSSSSAVLSVPLTATYNPGDGKTTITGGYYTAAGSNTPVAIAAITSATTGAYAYLVVEQNSSGALVSSSPVRLEVTDTVKTYTTTAGTAPSEYTSHRNVLLAYAGTRYRSGNVALTLFCANGRPHHEPLFSGG